MAFDGIAITNLAAELRMRLTGGRLYKIAQPETDELMLTIKNNKDQYRLVVSANASLPLAYLTEHNKPNPLTAPNFCMLLRKHLNNARITAIVQPSMERIIEFHLEHLNELGDVCQKKLIVEFMGKHSNIIFTDDKDMIIDSIKHVSANISSVREVLPGRPYFVANTMQKENPLTVSTDDFSVFCETVYTKPVKLAKAIYMSYTGISPVMAEEICYRSGIDGGHPANALGDSYKLHLFKTFCYFMEDITEERFAPVIYYKGDDPKEFSALPLTMYEKEDISAVTYDTMSEVLETYYGTKSRISRIRQKSVDLRKIVTTLLEKDRKKFELQEKQLADTEKREKYKQYGELITAYGYGLEDGAKELKALNYYTGEELVIPLDDTLSPIENAKKYFEKYSKLKRTREALLSIVEDTKAEIEHLESISAALDFALAENDLVELKEEMMESGYIRRKGKGKKEKVTSKPFHYVSSDGFHMYVGKNNYQNEYLTFKFATGNDWWFHAKSYPGSHVIVKTEGQELPDATFEQAAALAAYYSKGREMDKVEIDYIEKKHVKKVAGTKPGFVIYHTNYSFAIAPDIRGIELISD
ncbi:MAG: fibronectin/fibrinogen-binding protein [Lachnospiraceae bacterium]|nr:fibronectin/fibrinogen-binding protein [Lachnospiraceae bacterium]